MKRHFLANITRLSFRNPCHYKHAILASLVRGSPFSISSVKLPIEGMRNLKQIQTLTFRVLIGLTQKDKMNKKIQFSTNKKLVRFYNYFHNKVLILEVSHFLRHTIEMIRIGRSLVIKQV